MPMASEVTGLILAGGQGRRMGGRDKGLQPLRGKPLIAWTIERLAPQVHTLLINANRNAETYQAFGYPVVRDLTDDFCGPLAGLQAGLSACKTPLLASVPCDCPFLPDDLLARMNQALASSSADIAVARTPARTHPVFSLMRREVRDGLAAFLDAGGRKVDAWHTTLKTVIVPFDDEHAFANINTQAELDEAAP